MKISGFSFARNADKLHYPFVESIRSILPVCDEFVIAVGQGDDDDRTAERIAAMGDPKIKIIATEWPDIDPQDGHPYSQQANIALGACQGDWCFYIQCDEVVHERYLPIIRERCEVLLPDDDVQGLLFRYKHFWGDYDHYIVSHKWYDREIRIVRNGLEIETFCDAQSFRLKKKKLLVAPVEAEVFHYGYVRAPRLMQRRNLAIEANYWGRKRAERMLQNEPPVFDYGSLEKLPVYTGTYPAVMQDRIRAMDWRDELQYTGKSETRFNHDRLKYRVLTFLEQKVLRGNRRIGAFTNYRLLKR